MQSNVHSRIVKFMSCTLYYTVYMYRVAQKSIPLPNYKKIVLNRIKACQ